MIVALCVTALDESVRLVPDAVCDVVPDVLAVWDVERKVVCCADAFVSSENKLRFISVAPVCFTDLSAKLSNSTKLVKPSSSAP